MSKEAERTSDILYARLESYFGSIPASAIPAQAMVLLAQVAIEGPRWPRLRAVLREIREQIPDDMWGEMLTEVDRGIEVHLPEPRPRR